VELGTHSDRKAAYAVAFSSGGDRVAALSVTLGKPEGLLQVWDVPTGRSVVSRVTGDRPVSLAFAPDGSSLATGEWSGAVTLYDSSSGETLRTFSGLTTPVRGLGFTPDGQTIAAGASEGLVILWDAASGRERMRLDRGRYLPVNSMTISGDGKLLAAAGGLRAGSTHLWDLNTGLPVVRKALLGVQEPLAFARNHSILARNPAGPGGSVQFIDLDQDRVLSTLAASTTRSLAFSADGRLMASGGDDERVTVWEVATGRLVATFEEHRHLHRPDVMGDNIRGLLRPIFGIGILRMQNTVWSVTFSPDGTQLASASQDGSVWLRDLPGRGPSRSTSRTLLQRPDRPGWFPAVRIGLPLVAFSMLVLSFFRKGRVNSGPPVGVT
jgi:WD40 repeat protein